jgi:transposase
LRFILTGGERNDITQAQALVKDLCAAYVIADKGYDAEAFVSHLRGQDSEAVIPSRTTNKVQREIDTHLYRERHLIEHQIGKLKQFRRVFSRFDKLAKNYLSFIYFASSVLWLR